MASGPVGPILASSPRIGNGSLSGYRRSRVGGPAFILEDPSPALFENFLKQGCAVPLPVAPSCARPRMFQSARRRDPNEGGGVLCNVSALHSVPWYGGLHDSLARFSHGLG